MREGQTRFEWVSLRKDGSEVPMDVVLTRIEMGGRKVIQAMVTDISERKRAEAEMKRALEHERELSQLKSNFVSMVSHEFRTPLGIIQSSAEILDDYLDQLEPAERREQLRSIIKNSRRMAGLMEEVLVLGRLDAGRMQFQPAPIDLAALCRRLVDEVQSTTDAQCPIEFFTAGLPEEAQGDERLLRHILLNLLTNAVKYSEPGQRVGLHVCVCESCLEFVVKDRGIGIPADEQARLFEAFHRGSNVGQRPGTGLGLVIVKRCVELHGGTIEIESEVGRGTTVTFWIPIPTHTPTLTPPKGA
jgi:signal transduction histidine kinase